MKVKNTYVSGGSDIKDRDGLWIKTYKSGDFIYTRSRSFSLWCRVVNRTTLGSPTQKYDPTYENCENWFSNYQEFTNWCQDQYGYMHKEENDRYWHLDKDILVVGNRVYSPETCIFVPTRINNLFVTRESLRGDYPLGVKLSKCKKNMYTGYVRVNSVVKSKIFNNIHDAHAFWQQGKIEAITNEINHVEMVNHVKLKEALQDRADTIQYDLDNGIETIRP